MRCARAGSLRNASFQAAANRKLVAPDFGARPTRQNPEQASTQQDAEQPAASAASQQLNVTAPVKQQQRRSQSLSAPDAGGISGRPGPTQSRPGSGPGYRGPAQISRTNQIAGNARQEPPPLAAALPPARQITAQQGWRPVQRRRCHQLAPAPHQHRKASMSGQPAARLAKAAMALQQPADQRLKTQTSPRQSATCCLNAT